MSNTFFIKEYNICIVDTIDIISDCFEEINVDLEKYNLNLSTKINRDIKSLLTHHIFYKLCLWLSNQKLPAKYVFYIDNHKLNQISLNDIDRTSLHKNINSILIKLSKVLPLRILNYKDYTFTQYRKCLCNRDLGLRRENTLSLMSYVESYSFEKFTFSKTLNYIKRNNLFMINNQLFTTLKARQFLLK